MHRSLRSVLTALIVFGSSTIASAAPIIVEVALTDPISIFGVYGGTCSPPCERGLAAGWTQTEAYTNVSVEADLEYLDGGFQQNDPGTGHAYLMRQIGPGTTVADQVAFTTFPGLPNHQSLGMTTLFTGLTLGPGSYYLVLGSDGASTGLWSIDPTPAITSAQGVTALGRFSLNLDNSPLNPIFLPGEDVDGVPTHFLPFRVTGDSRDVVPEPASVSLLCLGVAGLVFRMRRAARASSDRSRF